ncbi:hypothetical protein SAMN02745166_00655 [Prosthecobacter debontii]|uniref:Uncharacterized protein n=1 Tax=Prosthecobacter debontii TaxID=48467 RepID=A0A1T4WUP0_9BACT|nr:hypothetical protein SAMN02745166_00655 [Prosthecobacter debontii]
MIPTRDRTHSSIGGTITFPRFVWRAHPTRWTLAFTLCLLSFLGANHLHAHACEFLLAKLEVQPERVTLEITADYGGNPLIPDEAAAREAVLNSFHVYLGGQTQRLEELEPLRFETRMEWDPTAPTAMAPPPEGQTHQLLTGIWKWRPHTDHIVLGVPEKNPLDVLLWTQNEKLPGKEAKWMLLIEGEKTPEIVIWPPVPRPPVHPGRQILSSLIWAMGLLWLIRHGRAQRSKLA